MRTANGILKSWVRAGQSILIATFALSVPFCAFCEWVYVPSTGEGSGLTRKEALQEALSDAVGRINGIAIATKSRDELKELATSRDNRSTILTSQSTKKTVDSSTAGMVKRYKILREDPNENGVVRITIEAEIARYEAKESNRLRLAVLEFTSSNVNYAIPGATIEAATVSRRFRHGVVNDLTSFRKFAIIDREFNKGRQIELERLSSGKVTDEDRVRMGLELAADFVLVGKLEEFSIGEQDVKFLSGESAKTIAAKLNVLYRLVDLASGVTVLAQSSETNLRVPVFASDRAVETAVAEVLKSTAAQVSARILQTIYPVKVIEVGEELVLNMGGETLREGQRMNVYNLGKRLKDPYTGEFLGYEEIGAGVIQITRVLPKVAYAAVSSKGADIKLGAICRPDSGADSVERFESSNNKKTLKKEINELFK